MCPDETPSAPQGAAVPPPSAPLGPPPLPVAAPASGPTGPPPSAPPPGPAPAPLSSTCPSCGAQTAYAPGTTVLRCGSCGSEHEITGPAVAIREHSYDAWRAKHGTVEVASLGGQVLRCAGCGATTETTALADVCQFCAGALIAVDRPEGLVAPEAVLPFHVDRAAAQEGFRAWVGSRWFAPSALKKIGSTEGLRGTYVPHWTFDAHTETDYDGKRGDHYYVTVPYQTSDGKGGTRTAHRQERRTRWRRTSGHVSRSFDDLLVVGSTKLDTEKLHKMGPWTLSEARPYQPEYLTGYSALRYDVDPKAGAQDARAQMRVIIEEDCERDIGGDEQRVSDMDVSYSRATFKLVLMPLWIATYLYGGKPWLVMVNANTGEVVGDRPWSTVKITAAVLAVCAVIAAIVWIVLANQQGGSGGVPAGPP